MLLLLISMKILLPGTFFYQPYGRISALVGLFYQLCASLPYPYLFTLGTPQSAQQALAHAVQGGLFSSLNKQRKIAACEALLEIGSQTSSGVCFSDIHRKY